MQGAGCRVQGACLSAVGYALHIPLQTGILCRVGACLEVMLTADIGNSSARINIQGIQNIQNIQGIQDIQSLQDVLDF